MPEGLADPELVVIVMFKFEHYMCISEQSQSFSFPTDAFYPVYVTGTNLGDSPQIGILSSTCSDLILISPFGACGAIKPFR